MKLSDKKFTPEQIRQRRINKKGITFNLLLIGENGIGKKTFINTLCNQNVFEDELKPSYSNELRIESKTINVTESNSIPIQLKVNYTQNFNLKLENNATGRNPHKQDSRIHVAIYFIRPTSRGLSALDIIVLQNISTRVNVIPVISKSDTLTEDELRLNKKLIMDNIKSHNISIFRFEDDEEFQSIQDKLPFSIISSNIVQNGNHIRNYPWGLLVIEESDCDFTLFKNILFGSHLQEFKDQTINFKYENYRWEQLSSQISN
ncbi:unnamed protein product [Debaryomyces tyrocola]|nr:unnamed protein product [Debaryomyces tyrocola]